MSMTYARILIAAFLILARTAYAHHDPNIHERAAFDAMQSGDCEQTRRLTRPAADRGEPWAQFRLAAVLIECPPIDAYAAIDLMRKAAAYPVTTDWERGATGATGPAGFFDARVPVARAALFLLPFDQSAGKDREAWTRLAKSRANFQEGEPLHGQLGSKMSSIESNVGQGTVEFWRNSLRRD